MSELATVVSELEDELNMTDSNRVQETAENVAHLRD